MDNKELIISRFRQNLRVKEQLLGDAAFIEQLELVVQKIVDSFKQGGRLWLCGNGGSAADAQHLAAEFSGRYYINRPPLPAEALHVNTSYLTAVANDFDFQQIFSRYIEAQGQKPDVLIGLSTSGKSKNVIEAMKTAQKKGMTTVAFLGEYTADFEPCSDIIISVPSNDTPRIQETHILLGHIICELVERSIFA